MRRQRSKRRTSKDACKFNCSQPFETTFCDDLRRNLGDRATLLARVVCIIPHGRSMKRDQGIGSDDPKCARDNYRKLSPERTAAILQHLSRLALDYDQSAAPTWMLSQNVYRTVRFNVWSPRWRLIRQASAVSSARRSC